MPAGYSGTPLVKKLGIKPFTKLLIANPPARFEKTLGKLPEGVKVTTARSKQIDTMLLFFKRERELVQSMTRYIPKLDADGAIWIAWPKKSSSLATDLSSSVVRSRGLETGMVDIKVCAVDDDWSGLKFVHRVANREKVRQHKR